MCHHWADDRDRTWERVSEDLPEEDPEGMDPERRPEEADDAVEDVEVPADD
jgi:hypothetical protein